MFKEVDEFGEVVGSNRQLVGRVVAVAAQAGAHSAGTPLNVQVGPAVGAVVSHLQVAAGSQGGRVEAVLHSCRHGGRQWHRALRSEVQGRCQYRLH